MKQLLFQGSATALVTPFFSDGAVDFETLGRLIDFQIAAKTDAIVSCGTTGESATMSEKERLTVMEYTVWKTAGRIPVIAGTGTNDTARSVALTKSAQQLGVDGILAVCPYYNKPTQEGILRHYQALAECGSPLILYHVPGRTASAIAPETLKMLSQHPNIVGLKDAGGSLQTAARVRHLCGDDLPVYSGDDGCIVPFLSVGGKGVISVASNLLPRTVHRLCKAWFEGDIAEAERLQLRLMPLVDALFRKSNPIPVKAGLEVLGFPQQFLRLPLCALSEAEKQEIKDALAPWLEEEIV